MHSCCFTDDVKWLKRRDVNYNILQKYENNNNNKEPELFIHFYDIGKPNELHQAKYYP